jgi:DNA polymerase III alpha subunit
LRSADERAADEVLRTGAGCACEHGIEVRPPCVNASRWDCTPEPTDDRFHALRLGLRQVRGLSNADGAAIAAARGIAPFASVEEVCCRAGTPRTAIEKLAEADAFHAFGADRVADQVSELAEPFGCNSHTARLTSGWQRET